MNIRFAQIADANALSSLLAEVWKTAYRGIFPNNFLDQITADKWVEGFRHTLMQNISPIFVYEVNNQILGMISAGKARDIELNIPFEIYALNISPHFQRQHIGKALMQYVFTYFELKNNQVYLKVAEQNINARTFYEKLGFINTEIIVERQIETFTFRELIYKK